MTIDRLGPVDPIQKLNQTERLSRPSSVRATDSIAVSDEAKLRAEMFQAAEAVRSMSDMRLDRIEEVKRRLEDPSYINDRVLDIVADRIMDSFEL